MAATTRTVTLALLDRDGAALGALPPYPVPSPWWQEVAEVVAGARAHHGVDVTVLRLLTADRTAPPGGHVTYLASICGDAAGRLALSPIGTELGPHPLRAPWAEPGGPQASLAWARHALADAGRPAVAVTQVRTWNLSAVWRLDTRDPGTGADTGLAWLKQVPGFFAHEPGVVRWLGAAAPGAAPTVLAAGDRRLLMDDVRGTDRYDAGPAERLAMLADLHAIQVDAAGRVEELLALRVPDRRAPRLAELARGVVARHGGPELDHLMPDLERLLAGLDERLAALTACGVPDTLVHGDFHPGNVRGDPDRRTIIDWGDAVLGHPAIDLLRMNEEAPNAGQLRAAWCRWWRAAVPGCDPDRAVALIEPVVALRNAAVYAGFLDAIEPSEWPYHAGDVRYWLGRAARVAGPAGAG